MSKQQKSTYTRLMDQQLIFTRSIFGSHSVWKSPKISHLNFSILPFSTHFWAIKTDLSGNSVWPQALGFQKLAKFDHFWAAFGIF